MASWSWKRPYKIEMTYRFQLECQMYDHAVPKESEAGLKSVISSICHEVVPKRAISEVLTLQRSGN